MEENNKNENQNITQPSIDYSQYFQKEDNAKETSYDQNEQHQSNPDVSHTVELLSTAIPYLNGRPKKSINMLLKTAELMDSFKDLQNKEELSACDIHTTEIDTENMLQDMKKLCTDKEREFLDVIINFINAQKIYNTYRTIANVSSSNNSSFGDYAKTLGLSSMSENLNNNNTMEILKNLLPPEQRSSFDNISMLINAMT